MSFATGVDDGVLLSILVQPRASKTAVAGEHGGAIKIRIAAPPVDGEANAELVAFLAKTLGVKRAAIEIRAGETSKRKRLFIRGVSVDQVTDALTAK